MAARSVAGSVDLGGDLDHLAELFSFEAGAADETAVAKRQLHVGLDVAGVHAAAVQNADFLGRPRTDHLADNAADQTHRLVGVLGVGVLAAADGPDGLVGHHQASGVVGRALSQAAMHLGGDDVLGPA